MSESLKALYTYLGRYVSIGRGSGLHMYTLLRLEFIAIRQSIGMFESSNTYRVCCRAVVSTAQGERPGPDELDIARFGRNYFSASL